MTRVVDGDTVDVGSGERVRLIGIDTPEVGQCGYAEASANLSRLVQGKTVKLTAGARDDVDHYGRLLRYVDLPDGTDAGLAQIAGGFAIARYDGRDGYGYHARQEVYVSTDATTPAVCGGGGTAPPPTEPYYANCAAARAAGVAPLYRGQPGYRPGLDGDSDGIACE